jgi:F-type H+-transporting ATPase subunit gamma
VNDRSVVSFATTPQPFVPLSTLVESENMSIYDDVDEELLRCYHEITLANLIYYGLKEGACSEQSARMTAMDAASKNASIILLWLDLCGLTYIR